MKPNINLRWKDKIFLAIIAIALISIGVERIFFHQQKNDPPQNHPGSVIVTINDTALKLEVSETPEEMLKGLSGMDSMDENSGMLFVHQQPGQYEYVMRDMRFGLDFLFISGNRVVDIAQNVPETFRGLISGGTPYDEVIEVNAGWVARHEVKIGNEMKLLGAQDK